MHWFRLLWSSSVLILFYGAASMDYIKSVSVFRIIMAIFFIISIAIGVDHIFFYLLADMEFHPTTQENWTNVLSVFIFTISEGVGVWRLLRNDDAYRIWMLPALVDLFLKGSIAFLVFNNHTWFIWDSLRAIVLLAMMQYDRLSVMRSEYVSIHYRR